MIYTRSFLACRVQPLINITHTPDSTHASNYRDYYQHMIEECVRLGAYAIYSPLSGSVSALLFSLALLASRYFLHRTRTASHRSYRERA